MPIHYIVIPYPQQMVQMAFCDLLLTVHKQVTNVSQHVFVILLWGILMSPLTLLRNRINAFKLDRAGRQTVLFEIYSVYTNVKKTKLGLQYLTLHHDITIKGQFLLADKIVNHSVFLSNYVHMRNILYHFFCATLLVYYLTIMYN